MQNIKATVVVVGGGPGGYVAAIRCGQLGLDTVLIENDRLGGTCLIRGCIPSKAVIHAAGQFEAMVRASNEARFGITLSTPPQLDFSGTVSWKDGIVDQLNGGVTSLLKRAKVQVVKGWATFSDGKTCRVTNGESEVTVTGEHIILATGSLPIGLPSLPFGGRVISSTEALSLPELPKSLVVVGGGYIGLELGTAFRKLGVEVAVVEAAKQILPLYDERLVDPVRLWLERHGVAIHLGTRAVGLDASGTKLVVEADSGERLSLEADKILVAIGRRPAVEGWGLEQMAVAMQDRFVRVDEHCATSMKNVWAIGDLVGEPMLAHKASAQGEMVAEIISGHRRRFDPVAIPAVCFTEPELVSVEARVSPEELRDTIISTFPFQANGRALSMNAGRDGGFVRIFARKADHRILKIQAVGEHVSELAGEFTHALESGSVLEDIAGTIHAHPTLGEAFQEAALKGLGHAIHI
jgi:dihydrolipoamide dehydrogenase